MIDGMVAGLMTNEASRPVPPAGRAGAERRGGQGFAAMLDGMDRLAGKSRAARTSGGEDPRAPAPDASQQARAVREGGVEERRSPEGGTDSAPVAAVDEGSAVSSDPDDDPASEGMACEVPVPTSPIAARDDGGGDGGGEPGVGGAADGNVAIAGDGELGAAAAILIGDRTPSLGTPGAEMGRMAALTGTTDLALPAAMPQGTKAGGPWSTPDAASQPGGAVGAPQGPEPEVPLPLTGGGVGTPSGASLPGPEGGPPSPALVPGALPPSDGVPSPRDGLPSPSGRGPGEAAPPALPTPSGQAVAPGLGVAHGRGPGSAGPRGRTSSEGGADAGTDSSRVLGSIRPIGSPGPQSGRAEATQPPGLEKERGWDEVPVPDRSALLPPLALGEAGAPASSPPPGEGAVARHIARQMLAHPALRTGGTAEMTLSPEELGPLRLSVEVVDGGLRLVIEAVRPETADLLRRHVETLRQELRQDGLGSVGVSIGGGDARRGEAGGSFGSGGGLGQGGGPFGGPAPGAGRGAGTSPAAAPATASRGRGPGGQLDIRF